ncbi:MAG: AsmA-like C-terminal region-containing protein, partial [Bacteroidota bacterium]
PLVSELKLTSTLKLIYSVKKDVLTLQSGAASVQDIGLVLSGDVSEFTKVPVMNLTIESDKVSIPEMLSLVPREYMKKAEGVKGSGVARVKIEIKGSATDSTNPDITGMISATNASIQYPQIPKPITNVNIVADFTRAKTKQEFRVTKFSANLGNNPLGGTMTVVNFDDPSLSMAVIASMNLVEVKDYYPLEAGTEMSGALKASVNIAGKVSNPQAMKATGTMEFQGVTVKTATSKKPVQNLNGTITFNNQLIEAKKLSMSLGKSDLSLAFSMRNYLSMMSDLPAAVPAGRQGQAGNKKAPKATASLTLTSNHLYTADIMGDEKQAMSPSSQPASVPAEQARTEMTQAKSAPTKQAEAKKSGVPLPNVDLDIVATIGTLTMEKFELKNVRGTMKIANGIINMQSFTCNVFEGIISTKGMLNMQKPERPTFDLTFDMNDVDAHAMLPKFTSFGERMFGKLSMNTTMQGTLNDTVGLVTQGLNGQGRVTVQDGKLTGVKVNKAIASLVKLPDLEEINFKDWANAFTIADGRIIIKDLKITALGA